MNTWYEDENTGIYFGDIPHPCIRYILASMTEVEKRAIEKYPFINKKNLKVRLRDFRKDKIYDFTIPKDYCWDGATIPRFFWRLIGAKSDPHFLIASLLHDYMCENHNCVNNDRYFADKVFERLLYVAKVPAIKRWVMFHCVDNYQKFCGWKEWNNNE